MKKTRSSKSDASFARYSFEAPSRHRTVHPHGGRLQRCRAHRKKQPVYRWNVVGSARSSHGGHSSEATIVVRACVEDVDETLAAADIDAPALCVDEKIVGITAQFNTRNALSVADGMYRESSRGPEGDQDSLGILVEGHRKIRATLFHAPGCLRLAAATIEHRDCPCTRHVHNDLVVAAVKLETLRMHRQREIGDLGSRGWVDRRDAATSVTDQNTLGGWIDADIVRIVAQIDATCFGIVCAAIQANRPITAIGHIQRI